MQSKNFLTKADETLVLGFNDAQLVKPVTIIPIYNLFLSQTFILSGIMALVIISAGLFSYRRLNQAKLTNRRNLE
ncbi:hypothetical protein HYW39_01935 [Candidatus Curtissbacteria bacterium]|nr:hypothetical protein [Candidatus Curtissbacteria bacterium]